MKISKKGNFLISILMALFGIATLLWVPVTQALNGITLTRITTIPSQIVAGNAPGLVQYVVTNNFSFDLSAIQLRLPPGVQQAAMLTPPGGSTDYCDFDVSPGLARGASCILSLQYTGVPGETVFDSSFLVCPDSSGKYCSAMSNREAQATTTIAAPTTDMPALSISTDRVVLSAGQTTNISVTNNSTHVTANNLGIQFLDGMENYLDPSSVTNCPSIAPGETCDLSLVMSADLPLNVSNRPVNFSGSNTQLQTLKLDTAVQKILIPAVVLNSTTPTSMSFTNQTGSTVTINNVSLPGAISHVTVGSYPSCANNTTCIVPLTAASNASGSGSATVTYNGSSNTTALVTVADTRVAINPNSSDVGQNIQGDVSGVGSFVVKNTGNFVVQNLDINRDDADTWLTLDNHCSSTLNPGASCTVEYEVAGITHTSTLSTIITATGDNIRTTRQDFIPGGSASIGLALGLDENVETEHFAARAVKISNGFTLTSVTLTNIIANPPSALSGKVTLCNATGSNCIGGFASDCLTSPGSKVLAPGKNCKLWYEATTNNSASLGDTSAQATISLNAGNTPLSTTIQFNYGSALYAGGSFTTAGGVTVGGLARWNGTTWTAVSRPDDIVYSKALAIYKDDLMVSGYFGESSSGKDAIGRWNGSKWQLILNTVAPAQSSIDALAVYSGKLYAGGNDLQLPSSQLTNSVINLAAWDGTQWDTSSNLNGPIYTLTSGFTQELGNYLYAGGSFTITANNKAVANIAHWDGTAWSAIKSQTPGAADPVGTSSPVKTLMFLSAPYIGGAFDRIDGAVVNGTAAYGSLNGAPRTWLQVGAGVYNNAARTTVGTVSNITVVQGGSDIYIAGSFSYISASASNPSNTTTVQNIEKCQGNTITSESCANFSGGGTNAPILSGTILRDVSNPNYTVFVGGSFTRANNNNAIKGIAQLTANTGSPATTWSAVGTGITNGSNSPSVKALAVLPSLTLATVPSSNNRSKGK